MSLRTLASAVAGVLLSVSGCSNQNSPVAELPELDREADFALFFPILRNYAPGDDFSQIIVNRPINDHMAIFACRLITRPNGATGIDYVLKRNLPLYGISEAELIDACYTNFFDRKIEVKVLEQDDSRLFHLTCADGLVAAIIGDPSTYKKFCDMVGSDELTVLVVNPDLICVTARGSAFESHFPEIVREQEQNSEVIDLTASILYWNAQGRITKTEP